MTNHSCTEHDPGDEDRREVFLGPWCENCGAALDSIAGDALSGFEVTCPSPSPGKPYVDCGRGGHMFRLAEAPTHSHSWTPIPLATARYECSCGATGRREKNGAIVAQKADRRRVETSRRPLTYSGGRIAPKTGRA